MHLNVQILMKWWPNCLALSLRRNRLKDLNSCSPCVSQDCELLPTSGMCSHDFSSQSKGQRKLHRSIFTAVCDITNLITLYILKVKEPMAISHVPQRSVQHLQNYVKVKWLGMLHKLDISVEVAEWWNADLYGWDLCDCCGVYMWVTDGGILLLSSF